MFYDKAGHHNAMNIKPSTIINLNILAPCLLETYIGNIAVWKHHLHLETWIGYWKQKLDIGNIRFILET